MWCKLCVDGYGYDIMICFRVVTSSRAVEEKKIMWAYEGNQVVCEAKVGAREMNGFGTFSRSWWMACLGIVL